MKPREEFMISISKLTRRYGDTVAVDNVTTEIQRGEVVGLLGHNGAGKTTVMKILTGYLDASAGSVQVDGLDVDSHRSEVQTRIGYFPENAPLYGEMLVQEYLQMIGELRGVATDDLLDRVADAIVATGLQDRVAWPISKLSKGLKQRVGIAQAILHKPDVLVLDEPTNGLDPIQIQSIRDLIRTLGKESTIILSTHILQEIEAVCDRVLIMIQGQLVADEKLTDLLDSQRVRLVLDAGTTDVVDALQAVSGVAHVTAGGRDSHGDVYTLAWEGEVAPVPELIRLAADTGWTIRSIAPEQRTLETVFKELQAQHIAATGGDA
jgi:ABC-2 type transport system ATP-binding protein